MARRRVMQLVLSLSPGGTERLVLELCRRLALTVESVVCCLDQAGEWASQLTQDGVPVVALGRAPGFHPSLALRIGQLLDQYDVDVLHCHHYSPYVYGVLATALKRRVRLVFTEHGRLSNAPPSVKRRLVNPLLAQLPGQICAVSGDLKRHMIAEGFPADRIRVVYNGIDLGEIASAQDRMAARDLLGVHRDAYVVGTVGRLDPVKNLQALIAAHASLVQHVPGAQLVVIGSGPIQSELESRAVTLGIAGNVRFAGYRSNVRELMAAFDVYVNSSTYEGVSLTILEAMGTGLPVVATQVGGNPEVVVDGETGILVPADCSPLGEELVVLAANPARRQTFGAAGRRRVVEHFSIGRMVDEYSCAYVAQAPRSHVFGEFKFRAVEDKPAREQKQR